MAFAHGGVFSAPIKRHRHGNLKHKDLVGIILVAKQKAQYSICRKKNVATVVSLTISVWRIGGVRTSREPNLENFQLFSGGLILYLSFSTIPPSFFPCCPALLSDLIGILLVHFGSIRPARQMRCLKFPSTTRSPPSLYLRTTSDKHAKSE